MTFVLYRIILFFIYILSFLTYTNARFHNVLNTDYHLVFKYFTATLMQHYYLIGAWDMYQGNVKWGIRLHKIQIVEEEVISKTI